MAEKAKKKEDSIFRLAGPRSQTVQQYKYQRMIGPAQEAGERFGDGAFWGAALTGALQNKFGKNADQLPPELEARVSAQENAERRISEEQEFFDELDVGQKSRYYRRILAEEAMRAGLPDVGMQLFSQVQTEHDASEKKRLELDKLGLEIEGKGLENDGKVLGIKKDELALGKNKFTTIYPRGSSNPNTGKTAWIGEDGRAQIGPDAYVELGNYTTVRPQTPRVGKTDSVKQLITPSEAGKLRAQMRDVSSQMRAGLRIVDIMKEAMDPHGSIEILGTAGTVSSFVTKVVDEVSAMTRLANKAAGRDNPAGLTIEGSGDWRIGDDITLDGTLEKAAEYAKTWDIDDSLIPTAMRKDETQVRRYKAALVNLAYAVARSEEPGNPRLSDDDFKRNLEQIASSTTSPETLRRTLVDRISTSVADFKMFLEQMPEGSVPKMINQKALGEYVSLQDQFDDTFSRPFGTAAAPGPGLTGDRENESDLGDGFTVVLE